MTTRALALALSLAIGAGLAAQQPPVASPVPDLEGGWVRIDAEGSGSFAGLAARFPQAALTAEGQAAARAGRQGGPPRFDFGRDPSQPKPPGEAYIVTDGGCTLPSGVEPNSAAFHLVQGRDEVLIVRENPDPGRHIFLDGRAHPDASRWTPTATGHSVGRYVSGDLVVETRGLTQGGVTAGGWRTPATTLTERYRLSMNGTRLSITYTWNDTRLYQKPHSYTIEADRLPAGSYAFESWCDSSDPRQRESVTPPKQQP